MCLTKLIQSLSSRLWDERDHEILENIEDILSKKPELLHELNVKEGSKLLRHVISSDGSDDSSDAIIDIMRKFGIKLYPLQIALLQGNINLVKLLLKSGKKPQGPKWYVDSLARCVFWKGNIDIRKDLLMLLIEHGFDTGFHSNDGKNLLGMFIAYFVSEDDQRAAEIAVKF